MLTTLVFGMFIDEIGRPDSTRRLKDDKIKADVDHHCGSADDPFTFLIRWS